MARWTARWTRSAMWKPLFLAAVAANIVLLYCSLSATWLQKFCRPTTLRTPFTSSSWETEQLSRRPSPAAAAAPAPRITYTAVKPGVPSREVVYEHVNSEGDCSLEGEGEGEDGLAKALCLAEASVSFHSHLPKPLVVVKDLTHSRYFAQRDLPGWTLAFEAIGFNMKEVHTSSVRLPDTSVFLCLSINNQDRSCLRPSSYHLLDQGQRFNQVHGVRESLWRKDTMCLMLREALASYNGPQNFTFPCWVLPTDMVEFREKVKSDPRPYIIKPNDRGEGFGIFIAETIEELDRQSLTGHVAQPLLTKPYLIQGRKFDFRTYVLVTSVSPLRAYFYHEGLVRFASHAYNSSEARKGNESQVLTNTSVGKKYSHLSNLTWTFHHLSRYLTSKGVNPNALFSSLQEAIVRTLLSAEYRLLRDSRVSLGGYDCRHCFQLLGIDVILDSDLNPYVIEVNGLPSMQLSNEMGVPHDPTNPYTATKLGLLHDTLQILFNTSYQVSELVKQDLETLGVGIGPGPLCQPSRHYLCIDLRDLQTIVAARWELLHRGDFTRIYPSPDGQKYSKLIHHLHNLIQRRFLSSGFPPPRTLWERHHLHLALERLWTMEHKE